MSEGGFLDPGIADGERCAYRGIVQGREVGSGEQVIAHLERDGREGYRQQLEITVLDRIHYELETDFLRRSGRLRADRYRLRTRDGDEPIASEEGWFRDVEALGFGGELTRYPHNLAPLLGCGLALRGIEFEAGSEREVSVWLANSIFWEVVVRVEKRERVSVPAGSFEAWRVRARPSFELLGNTIDQALAMMLPPVPLHFELEAPHRLLRVEFPTGPFAWNPRGTIEATSLG